MIKRLILTILLIIVAYLLISFLRCEINFTKWYEHDRGIFILSFVVIIFGIFTYSEQIN